MLDQLTPRQPVFGVAWVVYFCCFVDVFPSWPCGYLFIIIIILFYFWHQKGFAGDLFLMTRCLVLAWCYVDGVLFRLVYVHCALLGNKCTARGVVQRSTVIRISGIICICSGSR
jgi:hypothetical protein